MQNPGYSFFFNYFLHLRENVAKLDRHTQKENVELKKELTWERAEFIREMAQEHAGLQKETFLKFNYKKIIVLLHRK